MRKFWLIFSQTATVCLAVLFVVSTLRPDLLTWNLRGDTVGSGVAPATNRTPTAGFIGSFDGYSNRFHGELDELRGYERALSAQEITGLAAGEALDQTELLFLYLPFEELGGSRSYDRSGLENHAAFGDGVSSAMPARVRSGVPQSVK